MVDINYLFENYYFSRVDLDNQFDSGNITYGDYCNKKKFITDSYSNLVKLIIKEKLRIGDPFLKDDFIEMVKDGCIGPFDGCGEWMDKDGDVIGPITFSRIENIPDDAVYAIWFNK